MNKAIPEVRAYYLKGRSKIYRPTIPKSVNTRIIDTNYACQTIHFQLWLPTSPIHFTMTCNQEQ